MEEGGYMPWLDSCGYHFPRCSESPAAQCWVDRGMLLLWGFNHQEGLNCFRCS